MKTENDIDALIRLFAKLPGLGPRSARRIVLHLVRQRERLMLPLAATSLVPLVVFTITGVLTEEQAAAAYGDPIVLLFMGGFMLSAAAED